jgi:hypothetical protein
MNANLNEDQHPGIYHQVISKLNLIRIEINEEAASGY